MGGVLERRDRGKGSGFFEEVVCEGVFIMIHFDKKQIIIWGWRWSMELTKRYV